MQGYLRSYQNIFLLSVVQDSGVYRSKIEVGQFALLLSVRLLLVSQIVISIETVLPLQENCSARLGLYVVIAQVDERDYMRAVLHRSCME